MKKNLNDKFRIGDWIIIPHTVESEMHLHLNETNIDYYNKVKLKEGVSGPRKIGELDVRTIMKKKEGNIVKRLLLLILW